MFGVNPAAFTYPPHLLHHVAFPSYPASKYMSYVTISKWTSITKLLTYLFIYLLRHLYSRYHAQPIASRSKKYPSDIPYSGFFTYLICRTLLPLAWTGCIIECLSFIQSLAYLHWDSNPNFFYHFGMSVFFKTLKM